MKALCSRISAVGDEGEEETVGKRQLDMECASVVCHRLDGLTI